MNYDNEFAEYCPLGTFDPFSVDPFMSDPLFNPPEPVFEFEEPNKAEYDEAKKVVVNANELFWGEIDADDPLWGSTEVLGTDEELRFQEK